MRTSKQIQKTLWLITLLSLIVAGCTGLAGQATPTAEAPQIEDVAAVVSATGEVVPPEWTTLSVSTAGIIAEVLVEE